MTPLITAFACRERWLRKTTGNKMQRNNARKITGRAPGDEQKWTQRKRNKRAWKNSSSLWHQRETAANMKKTAVSNR